jgi:four helix bundle protein
MKENIAMQKSEAFAVRIVKLSNYLRKEKKEYVLSKQILRSGTSIGANLAESEFAMSKNDFLAKVYISIKEMAETLFWLRLLKKSEYVTEKEFESLYCDCEEIGKILTATIKTTKDNLKCEK